MQEWLGLSATVLIIVACLVIGGLLLSVLVRDVPVWIMKLRRRLRRKR